MLPVPGYRRWTWTAVVAFLLVGWSAGPGPATAAEPGKYALLVGCTQYPNMPELRPLRGPGNDIPMWFKLLTDDKGGFGFPPENVTQLLGWPDDKDKRPTRDNIVKGFKKLIDLAGRDTRLVIVMSGHGSQVPIPESQKDPLDPKNPEPDGLDEVFLPADIRPGPKGEDLNCIKDDEFGAWLDAMRAKGAHVCIVFDCCHSGTMTRGESVEVNRSAEPQLLGIPDDAIRKTVERAQKAVEQAEKKGDWPRPESLQKVHPKEGMGSLVAFYGAQDFEEAPELPEPDGAPATPENYYGLLSYTLIKALRERQSPLSYRELAQILGARYRSERGARPPTPFAEGDLDREVFGLRIWPERADIILERPRKGIYQVNAGSLRGLTPGAVLAVHPPAGDPRPTATVLGYVKVESATPMTARVVAHAVEGKGPAVALDDLPLLGRCEIAVLDLGDLRVKVACAGKEPVVTAALAELAANVKPLVLEVEDPARAEWVLRKVSPREAKEGFGLTIPSDQVWLLQGEGQRFDPAREQVRARELREKGQPLPRKIFGQYPVEPEKVAEKLAVDLPKIFRWQNLWRATGAMGGRKAGDDYGLSLEVVKLKDENDKEGQPLTENVLEPGQILEYRIANEGNEDLWVTMLALDANMGIEVRLSGSLKRGRSWKPLRTQITAEDGSFGTEGHLLFAIPMAVSKQEPNYSFLEQQPLHVAEATKGRGEVRPTPFGKVLEAAAFGSPTMRGTRPITPAQPDPAVLWRSWVTLPEPRYAKKE